MQLTQATSRSVKSVALGTLAGALLAGSIAVMPGSAEAAQVRIHNTTDLNVRSCPSTDCRVLGVLRAGTCGVARGWAAGRSWVEITYRGQRGFVSAAYVRRGC